MGQDPNAHDGLLLYANPAGAPMTHAWEVAVGERIPEDLRVVLIGCE